MEFMSNNYHAVFRGKLVEGTSKNKAFMILSKLLKVQENQKDVLFSGKAFAIKKNITNEQVLVISKKLLTYGIIVEFIQLKTLEKKNDAPLSSASANQSVEQAPTQVQKPTIDLWYAIKSTAYPHLYLSIVLWFLPAIFAGVGIRWLFIVNFFTLAYSIPVWIATSKGYVVDIANNEFSFPASDVENSLIEIITLKKLRNMMHRNSIKLTEIRALNNEKSRRRSRVNFDTNRKKPPMKDLWLLNISGEFGSQQFEFDSKQKRDECRSMIFTACSRKGNRLKGASDLNLDL